MSWAELPLARPLVLVAGAVVLQWLTTAAVALRAAELSFGAVELVHVVLLAPLAIAAAYRLGDRLGGVAFGAWTLLVWLATPWVALALTLSSYEVTVRDDVLPLALGLTDDPAFAAGAALLVAAAFLAAPGPRASAGAGLAAAVAFVLVPETVVFLVPVAVAVLALWRPTDLGALLAAATPALLVVAVWRQPAFGDLSLDVLQGHSAGLREYFWSQRVLQWLPLAGAIAVARRSPALALVLGGWVVAWVATAATRVGTGFAEGALFHALLPALPAYVVLAAAVPLLVPTLAARLRPAPSA